MLLRRPVIFAATVCIFPAAAWALVGPNGFMAQMDAAMTTMHQSMMVASSGDDDRDFATMMIPHHQGAIDMAQAELAYGEDERLRRLAEGIIVEQNQEIAVMRQILKERKAMPAQPRSEGHGT